MSPRAIKSTTKDTSLNRVQINFTEEERDLIGRMAAKEGKQVGPWAREQLVKIAGAK